MNSIRKIKQDLTIEWLKGNEGKDAKECFWIGQLICGGRTYWDRKCGGEAHLGWKMSSELKALSFSCICDIQIWILST